MDGGGGGGGWACWRCCGNDDNNVCGTWLIRGHGHVRGQWEGDVGGDGRMTVMMAMLIEWRRRRSSWTAIWMIMVMMMMY